MLTNNWVGSLIGGVICLLIAFLVPPYLPAPASSIIYILGLIAGVILIILAIVALVRGRGV
jgi:hypothetical protein